LAEPRVNTAGNLEMIDARIRVAASSRVNIRFGREQ
jgi:hypothetical protein